jgi:hypothetical protein
VDAQSHSSESTEKQESLQPQNYWIVDIISRLSGWLWSNSSAVPPSDTTTSSPDAAQLWNDWEWVLSKAEEISMKHSTETSQHLKQELKQLHKTTQVLKFRSHFLKSAKNFFESLSNEELNSLQVALDSSKRSKLISDIVNSLEDEWFEYIRSTFFSEDSNSESFRASFKENPPYEKNIIGSVKELV